MMAKLVIFDCDGVLINTEEVGYNIISAMLEDAGLVYSREEYVELLSGVTYKQFFEILHDDFETKTGRALEPSFQEEVNARLKKAFAEEVKPIDGVVDLLRTLQAYNIPFAVASNSSRTGLLNKLKATGLYDYFAPHIYSSSDVPNPKPAPDIYLLTASEMGDYTPYECLVVEDSVTGVREDPSFRPPPPPNAAPQ